MVEKILKEHRPEACLGVACLKEVILGLSLCEKMGIVVIGIPLLREGCVATDVDWHELREKMGLPL